MSWLTDIFGDAISDLLSYGITLAILLLLIIPVYLVMKLFSRRKTTFRQDIQEVLTWKPRQTQASRQIEQVSRGLANVFSYVIAGIIVVVTIFAVYLYNQFSRDPNHAFLTAYFGVGYVVFLLFSGGLFLSLRRRTREDFYDTDDSASLNISFDSETIQGPGGAPGKRYSIHFGAGDPASGAGSPQGQGSSAGFSFQFGDVAGPAKEPTASMNVDVPAILS